MIAGTFEGVPEAWYHAISRIYDDGESMLTEYGDSARYVNGMMLEITHPRREWHKKDPWCSLERIDAYKHQFKRESAGKHGFEYTYIDRMVKYPGYGQMIDISVLGGGEKKMWNPCSDPKPVDQLRWMHE